MAEGRGGQGGLTGALASRSRGVVALLLGDAQVEVLKDWDYAREDGRLWPSEDDDAEERAG